MIQLHWPRRLGLACFLIILNATSQAQTTWHVDAAATPPGLGTPANPFASIQYAIDQPATIAGDTLLVAAGNYVENIDYHHKNLHIRTRSGALATTITSAAPGTIVLINGDAFAAILEGFTITGLQAGTIGMKAAVVLNNGSLRRCIVRDNLLGTGIGVLTIFDGEITDCTISRNGRGIELQSFLASVALRNTITWKNLQEDLGLAGSTSTVDYCAGSLSGPANFFSGVGNLDGDAGLWDPDGGDLRLRPGSMCINAGDPTWPLDPDGSRHDKGALTYDPTYAPGPSSFCTGKLNSDGCVPSIGSIGQASATSASPFTVMGANLVAGKPSLLLLGAGKNSLPFQGGVLCIASPIKRLGQQLSMGVGPCAGTLVFDMQAYIQSTANPLLFPGALACVQWWGRDQLDPAGFGSSLSDGLFFGVAP